MILRDRSQCTNNSVSTYLLKIIILVVKIRYLGRLVYCIMERKCIFLPNAVNLTMRVTPLRDVNIIDLI